MCKVLLIVYQQAIFQKTRKISDIDYENIKHDNLILSA